MPSGGVLCRCIVPIEHAVARSYRGDRRLFFLERGKNREEEEEEEEEEEKRGKKLVRRLRLRERERGGRTKREASLGNRHADRRGALFALSVSFLS